jgi:GT2 family glycosyltransferase
MNSPGVPPLVSAIVLNYNGGAVVAEAVASLLVQDHEPLEVIVVDNGSRDGSEAALAARFGERIRLIAAGRNLGFGAGNNLGIAAAAGTYLVLLNNDAVAAPWMVRELVAAAERSPRVGMVAPKVLLHGSRDIIDTTGHLLYPDGLNRGRGRLERDLGQYDGCREALFPSGAAALYARAMLDDVGPFDPALFLYGDDAELGLRARLAGWECAFAPRALAYHRYSMSSGAWSSLKAFHVERNRVLVLLRHFPLSLVLLSPPFTAVRLLLHAWGALRGHGAAGRLAGERSGLHLVGITLRAWASALRLAPRMLATRWRARAKRRLSTAQFLRLLDAHRISAREIALKE